jgi:hypothetical protein
MNIKGAEPAVRLPSTAAERMRCYRERQRRQWRSVRIEISAVEIDALMKRRYLDPKNRDDLTAIGEAATAFISDALFGMYGHEHRLQRLRYRRGSSPRIESQNAQILNTGVQ